MRELYGLKLSYCIFFVALFISCTDSSKRNSDNSIKDSINNKPSSQQGRSIVSNIDECDEFFHHEEMDKQKNDFFYAKGIVKGFCVVLYLDKNFNSQYFRKHEHLFKSVITCKYIYNDSLHNYKDSLDGKMCQFYIEEKDAKILYLNKDSTRSFRFLYRLAGGSDDEEMHYVVINKGKIFSMDIIKPLGSDELNVSFHGFVRKLPADCDKIKLKEEYSLIRGSFNIICE